MYAAGWVDQLIQLNWVESYSTYLFIMESLLNWKKILGLNLEPHFVHYDEALEDQRNSLCGYTQVVWILFHFSLVDCLLYSVS